MATSAPPKPADSATNGTAPPAELVQVAVDRIVLGMNVRTDLGDLDDLVTSIKAVGILQPLGVEPWGVGKHDYRLRFGHRRLAAAKQAGLTHVPVIVRAATDGDRAIEQLIENLQRADLNALDTAKAYRALLDAGLTQRELGEQLGIAQPTIANTLRILKAPDEIQQRVASGELTRSHVEAIAKLPASEQTEVARRIVEHELSVSQIEQELTLADQRRKQADAERDRLANLIPEVAAKVPGILKKAKLDPKLVTLIVTEPALRDRLVADGFTVAEDPKYAVIYGTAAEVDPCSSSVRLLRWHVGWGGNYPPQLEGVCIDKAGHQVERDAAVEKAQAKANAEREAQRAAQREAEREALAKERAERAKELAPVVDQLTTDAELRGRVLLWHLLDGGTDAAEDTLDELDLDHWAADAWAKVGALPMADVERHALAILASAAESNATVNAELAKRRTVAKRAAKKAKA